MKKYKAQSAKGKARETRCKFPEFSPGGVTQDTLNSPAGSCDKRCDVLSTRKTLGTEHPGFLLRTSHCLLAYTKIPDSRRKAGVQQHKPYCSYKQIRHHEALLSLRKWWKPSQNLRSQTPTHGQPCKQAFLRTPVGSAVNSLLYTQNVRQHRSTDCRKQPTPVELEEQKEKVGATGI